MSCVLSISADMQNVPSGMTFCPNLSLFIKSAVQFGAGTDASLRSFWINILKYLANQGMKPKPFYSRG